MDTTVPQVECDLVMKGGVTSGIVYPPAILELQRCFRFRSIGGASAGAIAAALTAAAEHGRQRMANGERLPPGAGFEGLAALSEKLRSPGYVLRRFQPTKRTRRLFRLLQELSPGRRASGSRGAPGTVARLLFRAGPAAFGAGCWAGLSLGVVAALVLSGAWTSIWEVLTIVRVAVLGLLLGLGGWLFGGLLHLRSVARRLADKESTRFGICPGSAGAAGLAAKDDDLPLTDWLHAWINRLAGLAPSDPPLRCSDLKQHKIDLRSITSDLSIAQPLVLPLQRGSRSFFFREADMRELFPPSVARFLVSYAKANPVTKLAFKKGEEDQYLRFPMGDELPVVAATRMSLSFPLLLSAVPLYSFKHEAYSAREVNLTTDVEEHWLSDGGISSNFPIHIFDSWLPDRPVFGITLYDSPVASALDQKEGTDDVVLPKPADFDRARPPRIHIGGTADFLRAVFQTAQSHRDVSQSGLPSFRERIAQVFLRSHEGGLNLDMPESVMKKMHDKGVHAARLLIERYVAGTGLAQGYREHLWVRLQVLVAELEREFARLRARHPADWRRTLGGEIGALLNEQGSASPEWYRRHGSEWCVRALARLQALLDLIARWEAEDDCFSGNPPRPRGILRITPET